MKNRYYQKGDSVVIVVKSKGEEHLVTIDADDLDKVSDFKGTWHLNNRGYISRTIGNKRESLHRLIKGFPEEKVIDHIDGNPLNNRKSNLRIIDNKGNQQNIRNLPRPSVSGYRGVRENRGKWGKKYRAFVIMDKKEYNLGSFDDIEEANAAAVIGRAIYHPHSKEAELLKKITEKASE